MMERNYQVVDGVLGCVVDRNLTLEEALMWTESIEGNLYIMEQMKEDD